MKDLSTIFESIGIASIKIAEVLKKSDGNKSSTTNSSGDDQLKIDVLSDEIITQIFSTNAAIKGICSEEKESVQEFSHSGNLLVAYDPLDGSSLMDSDLSVGSIFGIYEGEFAASKIIASAYALYGPRLEMVVCVNGNLPLHLRYNPSTTARINFNNFDFEIKNFELLGALKLNKKGRLNATGGTQKNWPKWHKEAIEKFFSEGYRLRYSGGMVPDLHQILVKGGGLFSYPATSDAPSGKLRKLFEVYPFALVFVNAGGMAIDGEIDILQTKIDKIHDKTPCYIGSISEVSYIKNLKR